MGPFPRCSEVLVLLRQLREAEQRPTQRPWEPWVGRCTAGLQMCSLVVVAFTTRASATRSATFARSRSRPTNAATPTGSSAPHLQGLHRRPPINELRATSHLFSAIEDIGHNHEFFDP